MTKASSTLSQRSQAFYDGQVAVQEICGPVPSCFPSHVLAATFVLLWIAPLLRKAHHMQLQYLVHSLNGTAEPQLDSLTQ